MLKGRNHDHSYFHVFGCIYCILNQKDQHSKFEATVDEGFYLGYSSKAKAFNVFNLSRNVLEETIHVTFDEDSYIKDPMDHLENVLNELLYNSYDSLTVPIIPIIDPIPHSPDVENQSINIDEPIPNIPLNHEESSPSDAIIENENHNFHHDHPESQIITDVKSGIFTRSKTTINLCMFVNFVSMIELNKVTDTLKDVD